MPIRCKLPQEMASEIKCEEVLWELSSYLDGDLPTDLRARIAHHLKGCDSCAHVFNETRVVVEALGNEQLMDVPNGYSQRLYGKLRAQLDSGHRTIVPEPNEIPLGITDDQVELGSHLIYFWQSDDEFDCGVRFLEPGLRGQDHCVVFGHEEATGTVFRTLASKGFDIPALMEQRRITLLRRESPAPSTLSDIADVFQAAVRVGAPAIRYLGNLGFGQAPLPGSGIDDVLELEAKVTALAKRFPAVVVCMYDVNTLPGRLILKGGFQTHPLALCGDHLTHNPYYVPERDFLNSLRPAQ
jgi:MEDS: MEthanogen/methylotroph, DcmR Sensory domain/Putative zinc-finger